MMATEPEQIWVLGAVLGVDNTNQVPSPLRQPITTARRAEFRLPGPIWEELDHNLLDLPQEHFV